VAKFYLFSPCSVRFTLAEVTGNAPMGGWSDESLAFIWKNKIRLYSYSRCYSLPVEDGELSDWSFLLNTTRQKIENNLSMIVEAIPDLQKLNEYLEDRKN
jgi:hypothetical protein